MAIHFDLLKRFSRNYYVMVQICWNRIDLDKTSTGCKYVFDKNHLEVKLGANIITKIKKMHYFRPYMIPGSNNYWSYLIIII